MKKLSFITVMSVIFFIGAPIHSSYATVIVSFNPSDINVPVGSSFSVDVFVEIPEGEYFTNWGLIFDYNDSLISLDSITMGETWGGDLFSGSDACPACDVATGLMPGLPVNYDHILATLDFTCLGEGITSLDISNSSYFYWQLGGGGGDVDWESSPAQIIQTSSVTPIPEPATILLLVSGLFGLAGISRKKIL